jgi:hypothetical protein
MTKSKKFRKVLAIMLCLGAVGGFGLVPGISPLPSVSVMGGWFDPTPDASSEAVQIYMNEIYIDERAMSPGVESLLVPSIRKHWQTWGLGYTLKNVTCKKKDSCCEVRMKIEEENDLEPLTEPRLRILCKGLFKGRRFIASVHNAINTRNGSRGAINLTELAPAVLCNTLANTLRRIVLAGSVGDFTLNIHGDPYADLDETDARCVLITDYLDENRIPYRPVMGGVVVRRVGRDWVYPDEAVPVGQQPGFWQWLFGR